MFLCDDNKFIVFVKVEQPVSVLQGGQRGCNMHESDSNRKLPVSQF